MMPPRKPPLPDPLTVLDRTWKPIAGGLAVLAVFGWGIISPNQRLERLEQAQARQASRDSMQDVTIAALTRDLSIRLDRIDRTMGSLAIARCITERNRAVLAELQCHERGVR